MLVTYTDENGDEFTTELPSKKEVCSRCEGCGTHLNPSIGSHAYSAEEFSEAFPEEEDREAYFRRGGKYDVRCEVCKGANVVDVVDEAACRTEEQKTHLKAYKRHMRDIARWRAQDRRTMYYESGGYM